MDSEGLYDSLEEEFSSASSSSIPLEEPLNNFEIGNADKCNDINYNNELSIELKPPIVVIKPPREHPSNTSISTISNLVREFKDKCSIKTEISIGQISDISSIVPLYDGDRKKSDIPKPYKSPSAPVLNKFGGRVKSSDKHHHHHHKKRSRMTTSNHQQSKNLCIEGISPKACSKSYLEMFRARAGCPDGANKKKPKDTVRSIFGDSERSDITEVAISEKDEFIDAQDSKSDTTSFYLNFIEESNKTKTDDIYTPNGIISRSTMSSISEIELSSVSEMFSHGKFSEERKFSRRSRPKLLPVPVLGGLGPDIAATVDKLELRKKQLKYGQKASYSNRIKLMEMKVLKSLKKEIKESNSLDESKT